MTGQTSLTQELRMADLLAKTAHVQLKSTMRVLHALQAIGVAFDLHPQALIDMRASSVARPTPDQIAACEQASYALRETSNPEVRLALKALRDLS